MNFQKKITLRALSGFAVNYCAFDSRVSKVEEAIKENKKR